MGQQLLALNKHPELGLLLGDALPSLIGAASC